MDNALDSDTSGNYYTTNELTYDTTAGPAALNAFGGLSKAVYTGTWAVTAGTYVPFKLILDTDAEFAASSSVIRVGII